MEAWIQQLLAWLALPQFGLSTVFIVALISATLLPLGSEPAVAGLLHLNPDLFWQAILVATAGNTLGGAISWWTGALARSAWYKARSLRKVGAEPTDTGQPQPAPPNKQSRHQRMARHVGGAVGHHEKDHLRDLLRACEAPHGNDIGDGVLQRLAAAELARVGIVEGRVHPARA